LTVLDDARLTGGRAVGAEALAPEDEVEPGALAIDELEARRVRQQRRRSIPEHSQHDRDLVMRAVGARSQVSCDGEEEATRRGAGLTRTA
jgi:hypothetical protein